MNRLTRQLESQLGASRAEASQAQSELRSLRIEIEGMVEGDTLREVLNELRREGGRGGAGGVVRQAQPSSSSAPPSSSAVSASLKALEERSTRLTNEIRQKEGEVRVSCHLTLDP